jgi:hypothetical protein
VGALTIGRIGIDVDLDHPAEWQENRAIDQREFVVRGFLRDGTLDNTKYLRTELLEQQGALISTTYTLDSQFDAFYILSQSRVESIPVTYLRGGLVPYEVSLIRIGGTGRTEFQSNVSGTVLTNDYGLDEGEVRPFIAPPINHAVFDWAVTGLAAVSRVTTDGTISVFTCSAGGFVTDASWGVAPADFYRGSARLYVADHLRAGRDVPATPADWEMHNGIIRVRPETSGEVSTGRILVDMWGGSAWESEKDWAFSHSGGTKISAFDFLAVNRNDPECVSIRLVAEGGASSARDTVDLLLRRGSAFVSVIYSRTRELDSTMAVVRDTAEAGTAFTPTGASGAVGVHATSNDAGGNRYLVMSPQSHTNDTGTGGVSVASTTLVKAAIGFEIDGSGAIAGNTASDVGLQYFGWLSERVRAVWR